jgi:hypothetical protein
MNRRKLSKIFASFVVFFMVFSLAACSEEATPENEQDQPGDLEEELTLPNTLTIEIHPTMSSVYTDEEEGMYVYTTDAKLETMLDFYNNMPMFTASPDFTTTLDVFMVKTELFDVIEELGGSLEESEDLAEYEDQLNEAYENSEGVVSVVGVRGGSEEYPVVLPEKLQEYVPNEGTLVYFTRLVELPKIE